MHKFDKTGHHHFDANTWFTSAYLSSPTSLLNQLQIAQGIRFISQHGKTTQSVHCTITGPCLHMRHRPSAYPVYRQCNKGKCSESVQSHAEVYMLKACDACADMGQL